MCMMCMFIVIVGKWAQGLIICNCVWLYTIIRIKNNIAARLIQLNIKKNSKIDQKKIVIIKYYNVSLDYD